MLKGKNNKVCLLLVFLTPTTKAIKVHQSGLFSVIGMFSSVFNSLQIPMTIISLIPLCSLSDTTMAIIWHLLGTKLGSEAGCPQNEN